MRIRYGKGFDSFLEEVILLDACVQGTIFQNHDEETDPFWKQADELLDTLVKDLREHLELQDDTLRLLFQNVKKEILSPADMISYAADYTCQDISQKFTLLRKQIKQDPLFLLRLFADEGEEKQDGEKDEQALLQSMEQLYEDAGIRWNVLMLYQNSEATLQKLEEILLAADVIFQRYAPQLEPYYAYFKAAYEGVKDGDIFHALLTTYGMTFEDDHNDIRIIPLFSARHMLSISVIPSAHALETLVLWGIDIERHLQQKGKQITHQEMYANLKLLSDKSKFEILCLLKGERAYGAQLAAKLQLKTPTISYHMQALLNAGFVTFEKENNRLYYRLNTDYLEAFFHQVQQEFLDHTS